MATGNSAPAAPSAHPDAEWQVARDISTLVAGNDTGLSPCFGVVSSARCGLWRAMSGLSGAESPTISRRVPGPGRIGGQSGAGPRRSTLEGVRR
jgi:hypothetical protein